MVEGPEFHTLMENNNNNIHHNNNNNNSYYYYDKLGEGTHMSVDSTDTLQFEMNGRDFSVAMSIDQNSSVGSCGSKTRILNHPGLKSVPDSSYSITGSSVYHPGTGTLPREMDHDPLARNLMDPNSPTETLTHYESWTIDLGKLHMGLAFAQGAFGKLYKGEYNGEDVAIKLLERNLDDPEKAQLMEQQFVQEVVMLANLRHPNIVRFIGACRKPAVWCIITEYAKGGSVRQYLFGRANRPVPLRQAVRQALDVARGMEYVHGLGLIHRDLKSDNLLISGDKSIKIADFGVARIEVKPEGMTPETGTYRWMAPEMIQHRPYTQKVDVYSFGIVLWELVMGMVPFPNMTAVQAAFAVVNRGARPAIPSDCLPALASIMARCWDADPNVRPHFSEIIGLLEEAEREIISNVRKARFRCCMSPPGTHE